MNKKQFYACGEAFNQALEGVSPQPEPLSELELQRICQLELRKAGLSGRRRRSASGAKKKGLHALVLIAALLGVTAAATAAYLGISDVFGDVFVEPAPSKGGQASAGSYVPLKVNAPLVEKMGTVIDKTSEGSGLKLKLRGVVGSDNAIFLKLEAQDDKGKSLGTDLLRFEEAFLKVGPDNDAQGMYLGTDQLPAAKDADDSKAQFVLQGQYPRSGIAGEQATLTLRNLTRMTQGSEKDMELADGNLYDAIGKLGAVDSMPVPQGSLETSMQMMIGNPDDPNEPIRYTLPHTAQNYAFSKALPKVALNNAGIADQTLYLHLLITDPKTYELLEQKGLALKNNKTGGIIQMGEASMSYCTAQEWDNYVEESRTQTPGSDPRVKVLKDTGYLDASFKGISSLDQLKDYTLSYDVSVGFETVKAGEWSFDFSLDYQDTAQTCQVAGDFRHGDGAFKARELTLSPVTLTLKAVGPAGEGEGVVGADGGIDWSLIMKDGSSMVLDQLRVEQSGADYTFSSILPAVVDPVDVSGIKIGESTLKMQD